MPQQHKDLVSIHLHAEIIDRLEIPKLLVEMINNNSLLVLLHLLVLALHRLDISHIVA